MDNRIMRYLTILVFLFCNTVSAQSSYDVVVYGATPSGIFASINAARQGHTVALVEEYEHIGGLMTGGLSYTDFITFEALGGTFDEYRSKVLAYYTSKYGQKSRQVEDCHQGVHAEPKVTLEVFHQMIRESQGIQLFTLHRLTEVTSAKGKTGQKRITRATFENLKTNSKVVLTGKVFIDATYEGDLAAKAGAAYRVGRESADEYCERHAGKIFTRTGQILTGSTGEADQKVQGYNFRLIMTDSSENSLPVPMPANYDRTAYAPIAETIREKKLTRIFTQDATGILRVQPLVNRKADINDIKNAPVRVALLGKNYKYPDGDWQTRKDITDAHKAHMLGMIYFLQNDESIPGELRRETRQWGLARDEFSDNAAFPYRLYIREARRVMGRYVFTEKDVDQAVGSIRSRLQPHAIAIGDYALNCHGVSPPGAMYGDITEGDFNFLPQPFQIPYGVIIPNGFENLIVSVAVSASHVGFCGLRLEPTWSALGQAAGLAAHLSIKNAVEVAKVNVATLQTMLHKHKAKTIYLSDVPTDSPYFEALQRAGSKGFFHELYPLESVQWQAPRRWGLQYRDAAPYHDVQPDTALNKELAGYWVKKLDVKYQTLALRLFDSQPWTRGNFLKQIYDKGYL